MGKVIVKTETPEQSFARLELSNGDQVTIAVADGEITIVKMKWAGVLRGATLWRSADAAEIAEKFFDDTKLPQKPVEAIIDKIIDCRSADDVAARLSATPDEVLGQYVAALENVGDRMIRDISELPYPKDMIKAALRHYLKRMNRTDQKAVEALGVAYVSLSHFQPLTPEEQDAVALMESVHHTPEEKIEGGDLYDAVLARWRADGAALLDELRSMTHQAEADKRRI
ncbi:hypothetical protein [Methyloceanibacter sp.]|uniref:hypothetical protein n=1 Tax=Methyloceanibacter sp. TaxID=1965321 RepID=UPI002D49FA59|nr:hypothetical protein [Methyloceanibacter sp.]HZP07966.1 hypothetical protein [Methyloceanibacter sp.]